METTAILKQQTLIKTSSNRSFGIVFFCFFLLIALLPATHHHPVRWWAFVVAAGFLVVALLAPAMLRPLNQLWTRFSILLSKISTPLIMGIIFFLVLTPMSLYRRLVKRLPLTLEFAPQQPSYWINREPPGFNAQGMKNQF